MQAYVEYPMVCLGVFALYIRSLAFCGMDTMSMTDYRKECLINGLDPIKC